jgi:hypothetical protein
MDTNKRFFKTKRHIHRIIAKETSKLPASKNVLVGVNNLNHNSGSSTSACQEVASPQIQLEKNNIGEFYLDAVCTAPLTATSCLGSTIGNPHKEINLSEPKKQDFTQQIKKMVLKVLK